MQLDASLDPDLTRRAFLVRPGKGSIALAVFSVTGCGPVSFTGPEAESSEGSSGGGGAAAPLRWQRANLGFVSAYVLVRGGEAAIVDTGVAGSEDAIEDALTAAGVAWSAVGHVILTHRHGDHVGSLDAVLAKAPGAAAYAGAADIPKIPSSKALRAVADGDPVFGLRVVATPGHTIGHIAVLDQAASVLVAGDALRTMGGPLAGSNPDFTEDHDAAKATIAKLGAMRFETLLVGHGDPIMTGASAQVAALAAGG